MNAYVLRVNWLIDSIAAGSVLELNRYACDKLFYFSRLVYSFMT